VIFDIVAEDARGREVLVVEVKTLPLDDQAAREILDYMREAQHPVRFGMVADLEKIRVVDYEHDQGGGFACVIETKDVLTTYDPQFGSKRIFEHYLTTLVNAWIRDHVYHWKSETPPGTDALASVGLLPLLRDGDTHREVTVETDLLR
jgi:hypothetical protein